jgi:gluconolactonase
MTVRLLMLIAFLNGCATGRFTPPTELVRLGTGYKPAEGPVWEPATQTLIFSSVNDDVMYRWHPEHGITELRKPSGGGNGSVLDRDGRLITCESNARRLVRLEPTGAVTVLVDRFEGKRLNTTNDVAVHSGGSIWFTDPDFGYGPGSEKVRELDKNFIFRFDPRTNAVTAVDGNLKRPNGIAFSLDGSHLYVSDAADPNVYRWRMTSDGQLGKRELFAVVPERSPDGMKFDSLGRLWLGVKTGILVFEPDGRLAGRVDFPERVTNLAFGGSDGKTLFVTTNSSLFKARVSVPGPPIK